MEINDTILIIGIVIACVWLMVCVIAEGKNRKIIVGIGIVIDIVLFCICQNSEMLCVGVIGGLICGLCSTLVSGRKYKKAVHELNGVKNWTMVVVIFFVMIFLTIAMSAPELEIDLSGDCETLICCI